MDPNVCLQLFVDAEREYILSGLDTEATKTAESDMKAAHEDLCDWLQKGGFEPSWHIHGYTRSGFVNYYKRTDVDYIKI
jgi:hypothetical protein